MTNAHDIDRCFTIAKLIERWPFGRTKTYELVRAWGFPEDLVVDSQDLCADSLKPPIGDSMCQSIEEAVLNGDPRFTGLDGAIED